MIKRPVFRNVNILLVDPDPCLSQVVVHNLRTMGFRSITHVRSSSEAMHAIRSQSVSFLITDWDIKGSSGIELIRYLRRNPTSPNRGMPVIMLSGRGELPDVETARDVGITEYVIKPFSAKTLFNRIDQVIDHPRRFVMSNTYVGPERRRHGKPPSGSADRRVTIPIAAIPSRDALRAVPGQPPILFAPDFSVRQQLGVSQPLSALITPAILQEAQAAIDGMEGESLRWIREDVDTMRQAFDAIKAVYSVRALEAIKQSALSIKSRAGTFGYHMATDVARLLYLFLSADFVPTNPRHLIVIEKHLQVLMIIFAQRIKAREGVGAELYTELERLIHMYR